MHNTKNRQYLLWSTVFVMATVLISLLSTRQNESTLIRGEPLPDYEISLNATNGPTTSEEYTDATQMVRYTNFSYFEVKASSGNHVELGPYGGIMNDSDSQITSITGVTATFITDGSLTLYASYDNWNWFDYELVSGVRLELPYLPYFVEFYADGENPVTLSNLVLTYSCSAHEESLDKYRVYWRDDEGNMLETDYDVEPGTMPSYDGPAPTKDPFEGTFYAFDGWSPELEPVSGNSTYTATFTEMTMTFTLINGGTAYELTSVNDPLIASLTVPSTYEGLPVTQIGVGALTNFTNLESVFLPTSLLTISDEAFAGCRSLTSIFIPENVESISHLAFPGCSALTYVHVDLSNLTFGSINGVLFNADFSKLIYYPSNHGTTYTVPSSVATIDSFAFAGASILTSITIPNSVTTILDNAFVNCSSLEDILIPNTVTHIGLGVFANCSSLSSVTLPSGLTALPNSLFYGCTSLQTISLPSGLTTIGNDAFYGCAGLTTLTLPSGLTTIGARALNGCSLLSSIVLPSGLLTIGGNAFTLCSSLVTLSIPASVTSIGTYAFSECASLTTITVDAANTLYLSMDGVLFNKAMTTLIIYPSGKTDLEYEIPSTVTTITSNAFRVNTHLTAVYVPSSVTTIQNYAFHLCPNLAIYCAVSAPLPGWATLWNGSITSITWNHSF